MKTFREEINNRIIAKYDAIIAELEAINEENRTLIDEANKNLNDPIVREWARFARENLRRMKILKAERDSLKETDLEK